MTEKYKIIGVILIVFVVAAGAPAAFQMYGKIMTPLIVQITEDQTTENTVQYLSDNVDDAQIIKPESIRELKSIVANAYDTVFYVGHVGHIYCE
ncbi:MAG: hypothetical protein P1Q69_04705 [Candidatus Thorarchaeota archaeon]|nr:hypothetical protein [Candidatus Thorarchaeota archaeon]